MLGYYCRGALWWLKPTELPKSNNKTGVNRGVYNISALIGQSPWGWAAT